MKILVTGFEPFGGETRNPSAEVVEHLPDTIAGAEIVKLILPTVRYEAPQRVAEALERYRPDVVLSIGQAGPIERALPPGLCRARRPMGCSFGKPTPSLAFARLAANWVCKTAEGTGVPSCPGYRKAAGALGLMPHGFPEDLRSQV